MKIRKISYYIIFFVVVLFLTWGCSSISKFVSQAHDSLNTEAQLIFNEEDCGKRKFIELISAIKDKKSLGLDSLIYFQKYSRSCQFNPEEISKIIELYKDIDDLIIRRKILEILNKLSYSKNNIIELNEELLRLHQDIATQGHPFLATVAVQSLAQILPSDDILDIYDSRENVDIRHSILQSRWKNIGSLLFHVPQDKTVLNPRILEVYKSVAKGNDIFLAPIGFRVWINFEKGKNGERWQDWSWSDDLKKIFKESVDGKFFKLSRLNNVELLKITEQFPDSLFTQGFKTYSSLIEGTYFGGRDLNNQNKPYTFSIFREPFNPDKEIPFWLKFQEKYSEHPALDDALYRLARSYELRGDYKKALFWYYKSSHTLDRDFLSVNAKNRVLNLIDFVMSNEDLDEFLVEYSNHSLLPHIEYSKAVKLIREGKLEKAKNKIDNFLIRYKNIKLESLMRIDLDSGTGQSYLGAVFFDNIRKQRNSLEKLIWVQSQSISDRRLYEEAVWWFDHYLTAYNYLWRGGMSLIFPPRWEGHETSRRMLIKYELFKQGNSALKSQLGWLKSIELFQQLLKDYPNSKFASKASYSIGLCYYRLIGAPFVVLDNQNYNNWKDIAIEHFHEFVDKYPQSSMADDALFSIAYLQNGRRDEEKKREVVQILEKILDEYPKGDRNQEAKQLLEQITNIN